MTLLLAFKKAKSLENTDRTGSCSLYSRLSSEEFALKNLALIRAHLVCTAELERKNLAPVTKDLLETEPWLAKIEFERQVQAAQEAKDDSLLSQVYFQMAKRSDRVKEKIELLQIALNKNSQIPDPKLEDIERIKTIKERIYTLAPRLDPNPKTEDFLAIGNDWIFQRDFNKGRDFLKKVIAGNFFSSNEKFMARRSYRNSFKIEQRREEHLAEAKKFADWTLGNAGPTRIQEAFVTLARAEWTLGQPKVALATLAKAEKVLKKSPQAMSEINFIRARIAEEDKNFDLSLQLLDRAYLEKSALANRTLFQKAWILRKQAKFLESAESLNQLAKIVEDPNEKNRVLFWQAKALNQALKHDEATILFKQVIDEDPLGYYGLLAHRELNIDLPPILPNRKIAMDSGTSGHMQPGPMSGPHHQMVQSLLFIEEPEILKSLLDQIMEKQANLDRFNDQDWMYFLQAYAKAGLYQPLFQRLTQMPSETKTLVLKEHPDLLFPIKFHDVITRSSKKFGISAELMLSIIRQESAFDPHARSIADAMGLMQVLPSVATLQESKTKIKLNHHEELYDPEINIPIGASLLADLTVKYRGQFLLIAAAYNANEKSIQTWLNTRLGEDPLEFIEDIPFEETKGYVKLVLRNFIFYSRLNQPNDQLSFPNWCLEDLHSFKVSTN